MMKNTTTKKSPRSKIVNTAQLIVLPLLVLLLAVQIAWKPVYIGGVVLLPANFDFGAVGDRGIVSDSLTLMNLSFHSITVELSPSCACTTIGSYPRTLGPGQLRRIPFTIATFRRSDGRNKRTSLFLTVSHDGQQRNMAVPLTMDVENIRSARAS